MGMCCHVQAVNPADAKRLADDPESLLSLPRAGSGSSAHLEKSWHGLHFLLTGSAWEGGGPLGFLLQGGEEIGDDLGYGPARLFGPDAVQQLDAALSGVTDEALWSRFDPEQMSAEGIYPGGWDEAEEDLRDEYVTYFHELKAVVHRARENGQGLMVVLA